MFNSNVRICVLAITINIFICSMCLALDVETHRGLNKSISRNTINGFSLNRQLLDNLGFSSGVETEFKNSTVWELIRDGGRYEDKPEWTMPYVRSANHFHDPLVPLDDAGFTGILGSGFLRGNSALLWSQKAAGTQWPGGNYSWLDVRGYFLDGLRGSTKAMRDYYFAETFRGLGQLMHLVQDMSVPEHTRDDGHYTYAYEEWVAGSQDSNIPERKAVIDMALANPVSFDISELKQPSVFSEAPIPISRLFDSNRYDGSNPAVTVTPNIGLAEYSNANFLTGDTLFTSFFSKKFPSFMIWLGTSKNGERFGLHNPRFLPPDSVIEKGKSIFITILESFL